MQTFHIPNLNSKHPKFVSKNLCYVQINYLFILKTYYFNAK